jgi:hypothetical protein
LPIYQITCIGEDLIRPDLWDEFKQFKKEREMKENEFKKIREAKEKEQREKEQKEREQREREQKEREEKKRQQERMLELERERERERERDEQIRRQRFVFDRFDRRHIVELRHDARNEGMNE